MRSFPRLHSALVLHVYELASGRETREGSLEALLSAIGLRDAMWTLFEPAACHSLRTMFPESRETQHIFSN